MCVSGRVGLSARARSCDWYPTPRARRASSQRGQALRSSNSRGRVAQAQIAARLAATQMGKQMGIRAVGMRIVETPRGITRRLPTGHCRRRSPRPDLKPPCFMGMSLRYIIGVTGFFGAAHYQQSGFPDVGDLRLRRHRLSRLQLRPVALGHYLLGHLAPTGNERGVCCQALSVGVMNAGGSTVGRVNKRQRDVSFSKVTAPGQALPVRSS